MNGVYFQYRLNLLQFTAACFNFLIKDNLLNFKLKHCNIQECQFPSENSVAIIVFSHLPELFIKLQSAVARRLRKSSFPKGKTQFPSTFKKIAHGFPLSFPLLSFSCVQQRATEMAPRLILVDTTWTTARERTSLGLSPVTARCSARVRIVLIGRGQPALSLSRLPFSLRRRTVPMNDQPCLRALISEACQLNASLRYVRMA